MKEMGNWSELHSYRSHFLHNPYFNKTFVVFLDTLALQQTFLSEREHSLQNIAARSSFSCKFLWFLNDILQNCKDCMNIFQDYANIVFLYDAWTIFLMI